MFAVTEARWAKERKSNLKKYGQEVTNIELACLVAMAFVNSEATPVPIWALRWYKNRQRVKK